MSVMSGRHAVRQMRTTQIAVRRYRYPGLPIRRALRWGIFPSTTPGTPDGGGAMRCRFTIGRVPLIRQLRLMSLIRRLTATLSSALLLQLTLLGTGTSRTMHTGATMDATARSHAMSGMAVHVNSDTHESGLAARRADSSEASHRFGGLERG